jgi:predicted PurR-regulated permease PerM
MALVQHRAVSLPPAVAVFAVVAFGLPFGSLGVLFATPLAVVIFVGVKSCGLSRRWASRPTCRARHSRQKRGSLRAGERADSRTCRCDLRR